MPAGWTLKRMTFQNGHTHIKNLAANAGHSGMLYIKLLKYNCYLLEFSAKKNS